MANESEDIHHHRLYRLMHPNKKRMHHLHRVHSLVHLGYLVAIVCDQHFAHVLTACGMLGFGTLLIVLHEPLEA